MRKRPHHHDYVLLSLQDIFQRSSLQGSAHDNQIVNHGCPIHGGDRRHDIIMTYFSYLAVTTFHGTYIFMCVQHLGGIILGRRLMVPRANVVSGGGG